MMTTRIKSYNEQFDNVNLLIEVDYKSQEITYSYFECQYSESSQIIVNSQIKLILNIFLKFNQLKQSYLGKFMFWNFCLFLVLMKYAMRIIKSNYNQTIYQLNSKLVILGIYGILNLAQQQFSLVQCIAYK
ncbi:unnamed protein product [Paramecium primaurelia]|uniref:Transmembrane protein n=1 Tax=Paramecium primaurelia TaxID=5886 RepID=A0A8S1P3Z9_PARPR|nr:unnamed protein product [Paramecium primaurelia]